MLDRLRISIARGEAVLVLGAGVTAAATQNHPFGSWRGLIEDGLGRVRDVCDKDLAWFTTQEALLGGDVVDLIGVAQQVETRLREAGEFDRWVADTVGGLAASDDAVYRAIAMTRAPIMTTNYDRLAEVALGRGTMTWADGGDVGAWLRRPHGRREVFHLHGVDARPETLVLGHTSYQSLLLHEQAQFVQKVVASTHSLVFVGCGSTTDDPNIGALMAWVDRNGGPRRHFRLCRDGEEAALRAAAAKGGQVSPVPYGPGHADLVGFLSRCLAHPEEVVTPTAHDLVRAYDGMTDAAYPDQGRWKGKDRIFDAMCIEAAAVPPDLDALDLLPGEGYRVLAIATMTNAPSVAHDARTARLCDALTTVNGAYKVCHYVRESARLSAGPRKPGLGALLDRVADLWRDQADLQTWVAGTRAELAAAA